MRSHPTSPTGTFTVVSSHLGRVSRAQKGDEILVLT